MKRFAVVVPVCLVVAGCADPPVRGEAGAGDVPAVAEIVCEADGSTTVRTPQVVVQPDGIHVHAISRLDEPAEIVGLGRDIDAGATDWVTAKAPGRLEVGCNPYSQHGTGEEPATQPLEVLDPNGTYVDGEVQCSGTMSGMIADFAEPPLEGVRVPIEAARAKIEGLEDDDEVFHVGYPEQPGASVAVRRDGRVVATFSFVTFDGDEWVIEGSSICSSSGLSGG